MMKKRNRILSLLLSLLMVVSLLPVSALAEGEGDATAVVTDSDGKVTVSSSSEWIDTQVNTTAKLTVTLTSDETHRSILTTDCLDVLYVLDVGCQYSSYSDYNEECDLPTLIAAIRENAAEIEAQYSGSRFGVITFSDGVGVNQDFVSKTNFDTLLDNGLTTGTYSDWSSGLAAATDRINGREDASRDTLVIFVSDGAPDIRQSRAGEKAEALRSVATSVAALQYPSVTTNGTYLEECFTAEYVYRYDDTTVDTVKSFMKPSDCLNRAFAQILSDLSNEPLRNVTVTIPISEDFEVSYTKNTKHYEVANDWGRITVSGNTVTLRADRITSGAAATVTVSLDRVSPARDPMNLLQENITAIYDNGSVSMSTNDLIPATYTITYAVDSGTAPVDETRYYPGQIIYLANGSGLVGAEGNYFGGWNISIAEDGEGSFDILNNGSAVRLGYGNLIATAAYGYAYVHKDTQTKGELSYVMSKARFKNLAGGLSGMKQIQFVDHVNSGVYAKTDVSEVGDGSVLAWFVNDEADSDSGTLYVGCNGRYCIFPKDCSNLFDGKVFQTVTAIDCGRVDTSNVTHMGEMFKGCSKLTSLNVQNFDTSNVTHMGEMFKGCGSLSSLNLSSFNTSNVTNMGYMFHSCGFTSLDVSGFDTSNVTIMYYMFLGCNRLTNLDLSSFNTSKVTNMSYMFNGCSRLTSLDVSNFDTRKVTDMSSMFCDCSSLTSLDLSSFSTGAVTNMRSMFNGCRSLASLNVQNFDTSNVKSMANMFFQCYGLTDLNVSGFDTRKVTDMSSMFHSCSRLTSLDVSNFDTSKVTDMNSMFHSCSSLPNLDVSNFSTSAVTNMSSMFHSCRSLTSLDVSNFDTSKVTNMSSMFNGCSSLTSLNVRNFDTSNVKSMLGMFKDCCGLTSLDVSNFDTSKVRDMSSMFQNCTQLTQLILAKDTEAGIQSFDTVPPDGVNRSMTQAFGAMNSAVVIQVKNVAERENIQTYGGGSFDAKTNFKVLLPASEYALAAPASEYALAAAAETEAAPETAAAPKQLDVDTVPAVEPMAAAVPERDAADAASLADYTAAINAGAVEPGTRIVYTLDAMYFGDEGARSGLITVKDTIPAGMTFVADSIEVFDVARFEAGDAYSGRIVDAPSYDSSANTLSFSVIGVSAGAYIRVQYSCIVTAAKPNTGMQRLINTANYSSNGVSGESNPVLHTMGSTTGYTVSYAYANAPEGVTLPPLPATVSYSKGTTVTVATAPAVPGYTLTWSSADVAISNGKFTMPEKNVKITGTWVKDQTVPETYRVKFEYTGELIPAGAPNLPEERGYVSGLTVYIPEVTSYGKYIFSGWASDDLTAAELAAGVFVVDSDITVTGSWSLGSYMVTYEKNADAATGSMSSDTVAFDADYTIKVNDFSYEGYDFIGWNTSADGSGTLYRPGDIVQNLNDTTLYAIWQKQHDPPKPEDVYYVHHSSTGVTDAVLMSDTNIADDVNSGYLYAGYYEDAMLTKPITDAPGTNFKPEPGKTYHLKEINDRYVQPGLYATYYMDRENNPLTGLYLVTALDNAQYSKYGFILTYTDGAEIVIEEEDSRSLAETMTVAYEDGSVYETYTMRDFFKTLADQVDDQGVLGVISIDKDTNNATVKAYYVTPDGVKVTGTLERTITNNGYRTGLRFGKNTAVKSEVYDTVPVEAISMTLYRTMALSLETMTPVEIIEEPVYVAHPVEGIVLTMMDGSDKTEIVVEPGDQTGQISYKEKNGYIFAGWYSDEACTVAADFSNVQESMTVYAKYVPASGISVSTVKTSLFTANFRTTVSMSEDLFASAGFVYTVNGKDYDVCCDKSVFSSFSIRSWSKTAIYQYIGDWSAPVPSGTQVTVTPYYVTADGTFVYGMANHYVSILGALISK